MRRLSYRCGTTAASKLPEDFEAVKAKFLERVAFTVTANNIRPELTVNMDQAGMNLVPIGKRT